MTDATVSKCYAREVLDSRANPTVEAVVILSDGTTAYASVPSGASTGIYEAHEKRDGNKSRYNGKGVLSAIKAVNEEISPALFGTDPADHESIDRILNELDGTDNKSRIGANAILAVSLASAKAAAKRDTLPLYKHLRGISDAYRLPVPMMNILNGGAHASNNIEIQEFMIVPVGINNFSDALRAGAEIYHTLGKILKSRGLSTGVGDEGGFAPSLKDDNDAIDLICEAIVGAGYTTEEIRIALDAASSEWCEDGVSYVMPKRQQKYTSDELIEHWVKLCEKYPMIMSIEDGLDQRDMDGWKKLTEKLGNKIMLVGDDLFVTNTERLKMGIENSIANTILIKPNQIGTLTETLDVIRLAQSAGYRTIISHRSGETEDTTIADISVAVNAPFIKTGAPCRGERVAKYNRLLRIADDIAESGAEGFFGMPTASSNNIEKL